RASSKARTRRGTGTLPSSSAARRLKTRRLLILRSVFGMRKDHPPRHGLEHASDDHVEARVEVLAAVFHHDHGPVVQIGHALARLLALLDDLHLHFFA